VLKGGFGIVSSTFSGVFGSINHFGSFKYNLDSLGSGLASLSIDKEFGGLSRNQD
jgi:hypothetical protein